MGTATVNASQRRQHREYDAECFENCKVWHKEKHSEREEGEYIASKRHKDSNDSERTKRGKQVIQRALV